MIYLDRKEKKPLYQQLYEAIIAEVHDGTLKRMNALKPIRFLADEMNIVSTLCKRHINSFWRKDISVLSPDPATMWRM